LGVGERRRRKNVLLGHADDKVDDLARRTTARIQVYAEEFGMAVCIAQAGSQNSIRPPDRVGDRTHLHVIAAGKAMLAEMPDKRVSETVERRGLPEYTPNTIVDEARHQAPVDILVLFTVFIFYILRYPGSVHRAQRGSAFSRWSLRPQVVRDRRSR